MRPARGMAVLAGLTALLAAGAGVPAAAAPVLPADPMMASAASQQACARVLFVGVRGSGEQTPYGRTITMIRDALAADWPTGQVRQLFLDYPAAAATVNQQDLADVLLDGRIPANSYFASVAQGVGELAAVIDDSTRRCPGEGIVLAGYSQGAEVVNRTLSQHSPGDKLAAAILVGNPVHYPGQAVQEADGETSTPAYGISTALEYLHARAAQASGTRQQQVSELIAATLDLYRGQVDAQQLTEAVGAAQAGLADTDRDRVWSVCLDQDPVCDSAPTLRRVLTGQQPVETIRGSGSQVHAGYTAEALAVTLAQVDQRISAVLSTAPSPAPEPAAPSLGRGWWWTIGAAATVLGAGLALGLRHRRAARRAAA